MARPGQREFHAQPLTEPPPRRRSQVAVKLCFTVQNLNAIRSVIADAGGQFDEHVWTFGGYHRCDAVDPEGNIIQVLQPLGAT